MNKVLAFTVGSLASLATAMPASAIPYAEIGRGIVVHIDNARGPGTPGNFSGAILTDTTTQSFSTSGNGSAEGNAPVALVYGWPGSSPLMISVAVSAETNGPGSALVSATRSGTLRFTNDGPTADSPIIYYNLGGNEGPSTIVSDFATQTAAVSWSYEFFAADFMAGSSFSSSCAASPPSPFAPGDCSVPFLFSEAGALSLFPTPVIAPGAFFDVNFKITVTAAVSDTTPVPLPSTAVLMLAGILAAITSRARLEA